MQAYILYYGAPQVVSCPEGGTRPDKGPAPRPSRGLCSLLTDTLPAAAVLCGSHYSLL